MLIIACGILCFLLGRLIISPRLGLTIVADNICTHDIPRAKYKCISNYAKFYIKIGLAQQVIDAIHILRQEDKLFECHTLFHNIGEAIYNSSPDLKSAVATCGPTVQFCNDGCIHDVIAAHIKKSQISDKDALKAVCEPFVDQSKLYGSCVHGAGHGYYQFSHNLDQTISYCSAFGDQSPDCSGGAMMDYIDDQLPASLEETKKLLPTICEGVADMERDLCVRVVANKLLYFYALNNTQLALDLCEVFPSTDMIISCKNETDLVSKALQHPVNH